MLTTREFRRRRGPLMPSRRVCGAPGGPVRRGNVLRGTGYGLRHHACLLACLLSSGFYRRVYASSASERVSSFRIADNEDDDEEEED
ncbi:hypothetical protein ALC57_09763 [Trachymyrmex cornetzi]|uniref:Uncharacterized protein n=1 Tax=Trachymyrmex cornetzi TaxID=471704 RepID=A0A195DYG5_9HYME|nr:hypothetical protein ALC57_09763 [Trachymyrmex cornetzi]